MKNVLNRIKAQKSHIRRDIKLSVILYLILAGVLLIFIFTPYALTQLNSDTIIKDHIRREYNNVHSEDEIAVKAIQWSSKNIKAPYDYVEGSFYNKLGIFNMNGSYIYFFRANDLAWIIKTKLGNCGEKGFYFLKIMDYFNITARRVCTVEDHCWGEYLSDEHWISVEPNSGEMVFPEQYKSSNWSKLTGLYANGSTIDLTDRYLTTRRLSINVPHNILNTLVRLNLYSTVLNDGWPDRYKKPSLIISRTLKNGINLNLGNNPNYLLKAKLNILFFSFVYSERFSLSENKNIILMLRDIIRVRNIRLERTNYIFCTLFFAIIFWAYKPFLKT